jgi:hypothetical protein
MHKDDAVAFFGSCFARFGELAALFDAIRILANDPRNAVMLARLAMLGEDAASDYENMADCWREQLEKGGFQQ